MTLFDLGDPWQHRQPATPVSAKRLNDREQAITDAINLRATTQDAAMAALTARVLTLELGLMSPDAIAPMWSAYDARYIAGLVDGDALAQWNDLISSRHLLQAVAANKPLWRTAIVNGQPVARFDGSNDFMLVQVATGSVTTTSGSPALTGVTTTGGAWQAGLEITGAGIPANARVGVNPGATINMVDATTGLPVNATASATVTATGAIPQPFTAYAVVRASNGTSANECVWDGGAGVQISAQTASGGRFAIFTGGSQIIQPPKDNTFRLISAVVDSAGGTSKIRNNGVQNSGALVAANPTRIRLGQLNAGTEPLNGDIAAFGIYKSALTVGQLDQLDALYGSP